jgi:hypothetical protein
MGLINKITMKYAQMGLVSQPKRDRLGHPTSSPSIYPCSFVVWVWCPHQKCTRRGQVLANDATLVGDDFALDKNILLVY